MAKRVELVYGPSGSGKTTWLLKIAEALWVQKGQKTRWLLGDGGLDTITNYGLLEDGALDVAQYNLRDYPLETTDLITQGYFFSKRLDDGDPTSLFDPRSPLVAPASTFGQTYGMTVFEGLSVMSDYIMGDRKGGLAYRQGQGVSLNNDDSYRLTDGEKKDKTYGGVGRTDYGFAQRRMLSLVENSRIIPSDWVYWTAHEASYEDKKTNDSGFGPDVAGQALTKTIGASFGNTIHLHPAHKKVKERDPMTNKDVEKIIVAYRAYTKTHYDPDGQNFKKYYANNRMPPQCSGEMPEYLDPADPLKFYQILADAQKNVRDARAKLQEAAASKTA